MRSFKNEEGYEIPKVLAIRCLENYLAADNSQHILK